MKKKNPPPKRIFGKSRRFFLVFCAGALLSTLFLSVSLALTYDVSPALDEALLSIERQIRKNKTKLGRRIRESAFLKEEANRTDPEIVEEETPIETDAPIRIKEFSMKPMSIEEAILEMNMVGHQFFVFEHDQTGLISVVYQRKDGGYGLIKPKI